MQLTKSITALAALFFSCTSASGIPDTTVNSASAVAAAAACNSSPSKLVTFDKLAVGSSPSPGLGRANYSGFTVGNPQNSPGGGNESKVEINPASGSKWAVLECPSGASISVNSSDAEYIGVSSFYFASTTVLGQQIISGNCDVMVVGCVGYEQLVVSYGPYSYNTSGTFTAANMTKVNLGAGAGFQTLYFVVTSAQQYGALFLDSVDVAATVACLGRW